MAFDEFVNIDNNLRTEEINDQVLDKGSQTTLQERGDAEMTCNASSI